MNSVRRDYNARSSGVALLARVEARRAWRVVIVLGFLAELGAGIALAAAQVARRTSTAHTRLERASGAPDAVVLALGGDGTTDIASLPGVEAVWDARGGVGKLEGDALVFVGVIAGRSAPPPGLFMPIVIEGRPLDPRAVDEMLVTEHLAEVADIHVGDELPLAFLTAEEITQFDTGFGEPDGPHVRMRVTGIVRGATAAGTNVSETFSTPALARLLDDAESSFSTTFVQLRDGADGVGAFQDELNGLAAEQAPTAGAEEYGGFDVQVPSLQRAVVAVTARVLVTGVLAFGSVAAIAAMLGVALALRRHFVLTSLPNAEPLAAIGVTRSQMMLARWLAALPFVGVGTATAITVALVTGSIGPYGSLGDSEPHPGWHANVTLLAAGVVLTALTLAGLAALSVARISRDRRGGAAATSRIVHGVAAAGAPIPVVIGTGLAVERSRGRGVLPVRSALFAAALGIAGLVAVTVFAASLDRRAAALGLAGRRVGVRRERRSVGPLA